MDAMQSLRNAALKEVEPFRFNGFETSERGDCFCFPSCRNLSKSAIAIRIVTVDKTKTLMFPLSSRLPNLPSFFILVPLGRSLLYCLACDMHLVMPRP
jgi:hypothetical protein